MVGSDLTGDVWASGHGLEGYIAIHRKVNSYMSFIILSVESVLGFGRRRRKKFSDLTAEIAWLWRSRGQVSCV